MWVVHIRTLSQTVVVDIASPVKPILLQCLALPITMDLPTTKITRAWMRRNLVGKRRVKTEGDAT